MAQDDNDRPEADEGASPQLKAARADQRGRGRKADAPQEIPVEGWKDIVWRVYGQIGDDRVMLTAAGVTYYLLLALVPTLSAFVALYGLFNDPADVTAQVAMLEGIVPGGGLEIIQEQLTRLTAEGGGTLGITLIVSLAIALWSSSAGIKALFEAMNIAYNEREKRNFFVLNAVALLFTLGAVVAAAVLIGVVVVMPGVLALLPLGGLAEWVIRIAGYVLMGLVFTTGLAALYRWGPSRKTAKWRWITPGAVLAVGLTLVVSVLFSWYVANFGNYSATYGSLGALIGFLTWLWITVTIIIVGAELNSEVEHQTAQDSTTGAPVKMGARGAFMADDVGVSHGKPDPEIREGSDRRRGSLATMAIALPAALALGWARRRQSRSARN